LKNTDNDSLAIIFVTVLSNEYYSYDTVKSSVYIERAHVLSKKLKWDRATALYYYHRGILKQFASQYNQARLSFDSAIIYFDKEIERLKTKEEKDLIALEKSSALAEKAANLMKEGRGAESIPIYLDALELWKASNQPRKGEAIGTYYEKIATSYYDMKQFDKALEYDKLSLEYRSQSTNEETTAWSIVFVCDDFIALKQLDSALVYLKLAKPLVERLNNHRINVQYYNKLAAINLEKKEYRAAIPYYEKCVSEAIITDTKYQVLANQRMIGVCYVRLGEYATARKYFLMALPAAIAGGHTKSRIEILQDLVTTEDKDNKPVAAYKYLKEVVALRDSFNMENTKKSIAEIENKYQATEKSKTILQLEKDKQIQQLSLRQKSVYNNFLLALIVALLITTILAYRNIRQRSFLVKKETELQNQKIRELEKDKQLVAVDSMLKGQEEERSRLAKDLHDGLGGLLSGVKFSLRNMKDNLIMTPENMVVFERSLDMIDTSIKELRRVAHNMMPEMLTKFGLDEAVKEYCNSVNTTKLLAVKYQSVGMETRVDSPIEIIVYRIVQELLNNTLKHAAATDVFVQLIREEHRLSIVVEDNGKGFDTALATESKGAGWMNIRSRVDYLKGQLDIHSEPGKGTLVNIEIPLGQA
jgi:signal transduction histidine kinase